MASLLVERFLSKVDTSGECWVWRGSRDAAGYGRISSPLGRKGSPACANRLAYELFIGVLEPGQVVCHRCDNPPCVRPSHLFAGSTSDNLKDASAKGRINHRSFLNLRPGAPGYHGAGPRSRKEIADGVA
jgi:hypothetical protein